MKLKLNKSLLAPKADEFSSIQLKFLLLNMPFTIIINNYKSNLLCLDALRDLIILHNGFSYHPNKNVKTRAFGGFSTVLSPDVLNGLVVFAFFKTYSDLMSFLTSFNSKSDFTTVSYFSLLIDGHIVEKRFLGPNLLGNKMYLPVNTVFSACNKIIYNGTYNFFPHLLNKIYFILNAYNKSVN